ncbi:MFS transporter [Brooklawnia cerclae]|uniref:MFS transporter n=1 Tax=Brooklawnia cerclae TaxID=349934 RepID=A0ABX0SCQ4_9ACTN|nr:MFS transporter [Brooklawnia cerclae]NIH56165.1 putative MFS transporter [Brooklawnia cerclae]
MTQTPATRAALPTRAERLNRLPFGREHTKLLVGSGIGWALDAMDVGLISYVMTALASEWNLGNTQLSWIGSIGFVGMMIGASVGGLLADRLGRRNVFALTLLVYGVATGAAALSTGVAMLIVLRFVVGLGLGAELPVASTLVSEFAPQRIRGRMVVWLESFWAIGWIMAALLGYFLVPHSPAGWPGWRWALLVGVVPTLYALVVRHGLPESVRFLESKKRLAEAERSVREFERRSGVEPQVDFDIAVEQTPASVEADDKPASVFSPEFRVRTIALWAVWFFVNLSYYGAFTWLPTLLFRSGHSLVRSFEFTLIITFAQLPGYLVAGWVIEKWGRRATLAVFLLASGIAAAFYGLQSTPAGIIVAGCALSFFNLGAWGALYAIGPEIYPTSMRGAGTGAAAAAGRVAGVIAPLLVPLLLTGGGNPLVFGVFAVSFVIAAGSALALPERRNQNMVE